MPVAQAFFMEFVRWVTPQLNSLGARIEGVEADTANVGLRIHRIGIFLCLTKFAARFCFMDSFILCHDLLIDIFAFAILTLLYYRGKPLSAILASKIDGGEHAGVGEDLDQAHDDHLLLDLLNDLKARFIGLIRRICRTVPKMDRAWDADDHTHKVKYRKPQPKVASVLLAREAEHTDAYDEGHAVDGHVPDDEDDAVPVEVGGGLEGLVARNRPEAEVQRKAECY